MSDYIRSLKSGEAVPDSEPRRYRTGHGYIRLRWKIATEQYVETYEHRVVDGFVTTAEHVHHINKKRDDNRPENLVYLTADEHHAHHAEEIRGRKRWAPYRSFFAMQRAAYAENNRHNISRRLDRIRELREAGFTTIEIGEIVGLDCSGVSRYLTQGRNP